MIAPTQRPPSNRPDPPEDNDDEMIPDLEVPDTGVKELDDTVDDVEDTVDDLTKDLGLD